MPGKHGPNRLSNYLEVHSAWMTKLQDEGFVIEDECEFTFLREAVVLEGRIICLDSITLDVRKEIAILSGSGMNGAFRRGCFAIRHG